jgi:hypothetical protein
LRRNWLIFKGQLSPPLKVFSDASSLFDDFKRHNLREPLELPSSSVGSNYCKLWKPPTAGSFKVNWDASLNINSELIGFGCVLRNEEGFAIVAK